MSCWVIFLGPLGIKWASLVLRVVARRKIYVHLCKLVVVVA